ncbi:MAG: hypothetical protein Kow00121_41620 [Elainellaceae cyanobacterium]
MAQLNSVLARLSSPTPQKPGHELMIDRVKDHPDIITVILNIKKLKDLSG